MKAATPVANNLDQPVEIDLGSDLGVEGVPVPTLAEVTNRNIMNRPSNFFYSSLIS